MIIHLVSLILAMPLWAQSIAMPAVERVQYVDSLPSGYGRTLEGGAIELGPECRTSDERLQQCLVHEGVHLQGHGECLAYLAQYIMAVEAKQSDAAIIWARDLYLRYGEPACIKNDTEGWDIH